MLCIGCTAVRKQWERSEDWLPKNRPKKKKNSCGGSCAGLSLAGSGSHMQWSITTWEGASQPWAGTGGLRTARKHYQSYPPRSLVGCRRMLPDALPSRHQDFDRGHCGHPLERDIVLRRRRDLQIVYEALRAMQLLTPRVGFLSASLYSQ